MEVIPIVLRIVTLLSLTRATISLEAYKVDLGAGKEKCIASRRQDTFFNCPVKTEM